MVVKSSGYVIMFLRYRKKSGLSQKIVEHYYYLGNDIRKFHCKGIICPSLINSLTLNHYLLGRQNLYRILGRAHIHTLQVPQAQMFNY
jgi:hypothetical protein